MNPRSLAGVIVGSDKVQRLLCQNRDTIIGLTRVTYYDGRPEADEEKKHLAEYWDAVQKLSVTHLGFGTVRRGGRRRGPEQKGVDTLIAVDMVVGAFTKIFDMAILIAGDGDFVPVLEEVGRRGIITVVGGHTSSVSDDLLRACDLFVPIDPPTPSEHWYPLGKWYADPPEAETAR